MKKLSILIILFLISCNTNTKDNKNVKSTNPEEDKIVYEEPKITGKKYFDYDELIHYKINFPDGNLAKLDNNAKKSKLDSIKKGILIENIPEKITGDDFLTQLENVGYKKSNVSTEKFDEINDIFTEKKHKIYDVTACVYIFRDILVFKKKSKVIGIAKICFGCGGHTILGTKSNTTEFGQSGEYWELEKILNDK